MTLWMKQVKVKQEAEAGSPMVDTELDAVLMVDMVDLVDVVDLK